MKPERHQITNASGDRITITGWIFPVPSSGWTGQEMREALENHLRDGYGIADSFDRDAVIREITPMTGRQGGPDIAYIPEFAVQEAVATIKGAIADPAARATFTQDPAGKGNFAGGYMQSNVQSVPTTSAGSKGDRTPSEFWESSWYATNVEPREFDSYDDALNFMLENNDVTVPADASPADKLKAWTDAGYPALNIQPGEFGGFAVRPLDPKDAPKTVPDPEIMATDQGLYQLADGEWSPLGLPSSPASMEYMGGMLWMRGTDGSLAPVNNVLERMVEQKILEGDWETALQWDDFRNRPTPQQHLESMLEYARTPADQVLLSAIARGYAEGLVPPQAGSLARVGPIPKEATDAWERYERSITGGPARAEMEEFLASEQAEKEQDKADYFQSMTDMRDAFQKSIQEVEKSNAQSIKDFVGSITKGMEALGTKITDVSSSLSSQITETAGTETVVETDITDTSGSEQIGGSGSGSPIPAIQRELNALKQQWLNDNPGMTLEDSGFDGSVHIDDQIAWLNNEANWPNKIDTITAAVDRLGVLQDEPDLQDILADYETASGQVAALQEAGEKPGSVFGVGPGLVDWGSEARLPDPAGTSVAETQYVYQQADPDWTMGDDSWQGQYFEPLAEAERQAIVDRGPTEGQAGFEAGLWEGAEGGVVQGPTLALLGEKESEVVVPFSKIDDFRRGILPVKNSKITQTGSRVAEFAEGGLVFGADEVTARGGSESVRGLPGYKGSDRYITSDTLSRLKSGELMQDINDPSNIYAPGARTTEATERLDVAQADITSRPRTFEQSLANVTGGEQGNLPIGVQQVLGGRSPRPLAGRLLRQAGMALPSAQAWRNLSPDERSVYTDLARRSGISEGYLESELQTATPSGGGGARRARMLPLATRRIFR